MRAHRFGIAVVATALGALVTAAGGCGNETGTGSGGATTSSSTTGSEVSSSSTGGTTGSSSSSGMTSSSGSSSTSSGGMTAGHCAKPCASPADCCTPGTPDCPSSTYPNNYTCVGGACLNPQCNSTSDCTAQSPKLDCFAISGVKDCAFACALDADCTAPLTCIGVDDGGKKYCLSKGSGCTDAMCASLGIGKCIEGVCSCEADSECLKPGFSKCSK